MIEKCCNIDKDEYLVRLHEEILKVMDVIHDICIRNGIKYYLAYGSLLGAVRHHGFIPWDDDMDIVIPRNDYQKFLEICKNQLPCGYEIKHMNKDSDYWYAYAKVYNKNTLYSERLYNKRVSNFGIFVDVFPLDEISDVNNTVSIRKFLIQKINNMLVEKVYPGSFNSFKRAIVNLTPKNFLVKCLNCLMTLSNNKGYKKYVNFVSRYSIKKDTQNKSSFGSGKMMQFENRSYMVPDYYKKILITMYGKKYMQLPPKKDRRAHLPVKVVFSDGRMYEQQNRQ